MLGTHNHIYYVFSISNKIFNKKEVIAMKLNKKAFTLVEILAVVAILAILATLVIPSVTKYLKGGKEDYDENLKKQLILVAKNYYAENRDRLPKKDGSISSYVTLKELISLKYTSKDFIDSKGNNCNNDTYVTARLNLESDNIDYYACMKCGEEKYYDDDENCKLLSNTESDPENPDKTVDYGITCSVEAVKGTYSTAKLSIKSENSDITKIQWQKTGNNKWNTLDITNESDKKIIIKQIDVNDLDGFGNYTFRATNVAEKIKECGSYTYHETPSTITATISHEVYLVEDESLVDKKVEDIAQRGVKYDGNWSKGWIYVKLNFDSNKFNSVKAGTEDLMKNKYFWIKDEGEQTVEVKYVDSSGNSGIINIKAKLDRTPPKIEPISNSSNGEWTKYDVTVKVSATDQLSGVKNINFGTADHEKTTNTFDGKYDSYTGIGTEKASATKKWKATDQDISMFIKVVDAAGNEAITCNSMLNGQCYTNVRQDITPPYINPSDIWHCGRGKSGQGYDCDKYIYYFHDNLSGVYQMKHGHCYKGYSCTSFSGAKAALDSKKLEVRNWPDSGWRTVNYCMDAGYTAYIYFEVWDRAENHAIFGPYTDSVNSAACVKTAKCSCEG